MLSRTIRQTPRALHGIAARGFATSIAVVPLRFQKLIPDKAGQVAGLAV
jgi:hypothetical protein